MALVKGGNAMAMLDLWLLWLMVILDENVQEGLLGGFNKPLG